MTLIYNDTQSCLKFDCLPYLFKPIPAKSGYSVMRVLGFVRGERVYADIQMASGRYYADVVTGTLYQSNGQRLGGATALPVATLEHCTLEEAKDWVAGAKRREKQTGAQVWMAQGVPGVLE